MHDEEARRIAVEESYEYKKPRDKEEKRFLRIIAHFDDILFKEALLGEPVKEGEKSASLPLKFKLQGEGMFVAFFFHIFSLAVYILSLVLAFWVRYNPESTNLDRLLFSNPLYNYLAALLSAAILSAVPLLFIRRYIIYPEGYLFTRVKNFLIGYWLSLLILIFLLGIRTVVVRLGGESLVGRVLPAVYSFIENHPEGFIVVLATTALILSLSGFLLLVITRKDYLNAIGLLLLTAGTTLGVVFGLLYKYGYSLENAQWLIYYLTMFLMSSFSDSTELLSLLIPLLTYFIFHLKVKSLQKKMYGMPYS